MAKKQISWTKTSLSELENILAFYLERNQSSVYSNWLLLEIEKRINLISHYSKIGRKTDITNLRLFPFNNYGIFYKIYSNKIVIVSIWDFQRNPLNRIDLK